MIKSFGNRIARDIWERERSNDLPTALWTRAKALLTIIHSTTMIRDLKVRGQPPNIRLHKLKGNRKGFWSVTITLPWCLTFKFVNGEFLDVRIEDYHKE